MIILASVPFISSSRADSVLPPIALHAKDGIPKVLVRLGNSVVLTQESSFRGNSQRENSSNHVVAY
jgi:hypothetical protein